MADASVETKPRPVIRGTQHCPVCGLPPESVVSSYVERGVSKAHMIDAQGHVWNVSWPVAV